MLLFKLEIEIVHTGFKKTTAVHCCRFLDQKPVCAGLLEGHSFEGYSTVSGIINT